MQRTVLSCKTGSCHLHIRRIKMVAVAVGNQTVANLRPVHLILNRMPHRVRRKVHQKLVVDNGLRAGTDITSFLFLCLLTDIACAKKRRNPLKSRCAQIFYFHCVLPRFLSLLLNYSTILPVMARKFVSLKSPGSFPSGNFFN